MTLFGTTKGLCELGGFLNQDGTVPQGRYIILLVGGINIISGLFYGPTFSVSPESSSGIRAGAKTGLTAVTCGVFYLISLFFAPFFLEIPPAATSPILITTGMLMFMNVQRVNFTEAKYAFPAFLTLFFIPFTFSTLCGLVIGYTCYIFVSIYTLDIIDYAHDLYNEYFPKRKTEEVVELETGTVAVPLPPAPKFNARRASVMLIQNMTSEVNMATDMSAPVL